MLEIETEIAVAQEEKKLAQLCEMHNSTLTCDFMSKFKKKQQLIIDPILDQKT